jgi:hypothetical protein
MSHHQEARFKSACGDAALRTPEDCLRLGFIHAKAKAWTMTSDPRTRRAIQGAQGWMALAFALRDGHPMLAAVRAKGGA